MNLQELLYNKSVQKHFGITIRDNVPTLKFAENIQVVGVNIGNNRMAIISNDIEKISIEDIREILLDFNIVTYLSDYELNGSDVWDLHCIWLDEEESNLTITRYSESLAILVIELKWHRKLELNELKGSDAL